MYFRVEIQIDGILKLRIVGLSLGLVLAVTTWQPVSKFELDNKLKKRTFRSQTFWVKLVSCIRDLVVTGKIVTSSGPSASSTIRAVHGFEGTRARGHGSGSVGTYSIPRFGGDLEDTVSLFYVQLSYSPTRSFRFLSL